MSERIRVAGLGSARRVALKKLMHEMQTKLATGPRVTPRDNFAKKKGVSVAVNSQAQLKAAGNTTPSATSKTMTRTVRSVRRVKVAKKNGRAATPKKASTPKFPTATPPRPVVNALILNATGPLSASPSRAPGGGPNTEVNVGGITVPCLFSGEFLFLYFDFI